MPKDVELEIAIVGWSCRFAGAGDVDEFSRRNLSDVTAALSLEEPDYFDARFYGFSPQEASAMDSEQCILLELAHEALENAGYDADRVQAPIGVFVGLAENTQTSGKADNSLSAWISSELGLQGPSVTVRTVDSPFMRAVYRARESLLSGKTEIALAGAFSPRCAHDLGQVRGGGVVVLKRLANSLAQGDAIQLIIKEVTLDPEASAPANSTPPKPAGLGPAAEVAALIEAACALKQTSSSPENHSAALPLLLAAAPQAPASANARASHLLILSAKTASALDQATHRLREFLQSRNPVNMSDVAHTLQIGRRAYAHRRMLLCTDQVDAISALTEKSSNRVLSNRTHDSRRPIVWLLPGVGDQYVGMAHDLYATWDVFRQEVDRCAQILEQHLGIDIRSILYPPNQNWKKNNQSKGIDLKRMLGRSADEPQDPDTINLNRTLFAQPALFTIEYAMGRLWQSFGVTPDAIVGHSMGEYVSACLAGVFSLSDALRLIAARAKLVDELPQGTMLAVMLPEDELRPMLPADLFISLINGPSHCVVAGLPAAVSNFEAVLAAREVIARRVQNGHAFHTRMMDPIVESFEAEVRKVRLSAPRIPYISNVTGDWVTAAQATDPAYWVKHVNHTARFSDALRRVWQLRNPILIECGPGRTLSVLAAQHPDRKGTLQGAIWSIRQRYENEPDEKILLGAIGKVWLAGGSIGWDQIDPRGGRRRIPLPTHPHEREYCWTANASGVTPKVLERLGEGEQDAPVNQELNDTPASRREEELVAIWKTALGRSHVGVNDNFGALGGDSLSSIGAMMDMKRVGVPDDVARGIFRGLTIRQIARQATEGGVAVGSASTQLVSIETPVFIRAFFIFIVVAGHFGLTNMFGFGALMMVSGLSFAKFQLRSIEKEQSIKPVFYFMLRIAIPTLLITIFFQIFFHAIRIRSWFFFDNWIDPYLDAHFGSPWFIDLLLQNLAILAVPLSFSLVREFAVRKAYIYGMILLFVSWIASVTIPLYWDANGLYNRVPHMQLWLMAFGWCAAYSATKKEKILSSAAFLSLSSISFLFGQGLTWYLIVAGIAITWFDEIPARLPQNLVRVINAAAGASLFIYLTHFEFNSLLHKFWTQAPPLLSVGCAMLGGFAVWKAWNLASKTALGWVAKYRTPVPAGSW